MKYEIFAVNDEPYCIWHPDIAQQNQALIRNIEPDYWKYIALKHIDDLEVDNRNRAAIALRIAYHHGLETLFTLIAATIQAPLAVVAWIPRCRTHDLRNVVTTVSAKKELLSILRVDAPSWSDVANAILMHARFGEAGSESEETCVNFGRMWSRFAQDFLDEDHIGEYNAMKHGFRMRAGGFGLAVGVEEEYGVPAPPEKMQSLGMSEFGSSFFVPKDVEGRRHFTLREQSLNWSPEAAANGLCLISLSLRNVLSFLRILNGENPSTVKFHRPSSENAYDAPWRHGPGTMRFATAPVISSEHIIRFSKDEMSERLQKHRERALERLSKKEPSK